MKSIVLVSMVLALSASACAGADWHRAGVASDYRPERRVNLVVAVHTQGEDLDDAAEELSNAVREGLAEEGIQATLVRGPAPAPAVRLDIVHWDPGSRGLRWLGGPFGSGEGDLNVIVRVDRADGTPALEGEVRGYVRGGAFGGSSVASAEEAGEAIAHAIATGTL